MAKVLDTDSNSLSVVSPPPQTDAVSQDLNINNRSDLAKLQAIMKASASLNFNNPSDITNLQTIMEEAGWSLLPSQLALFRPDSPQNTADSAESSNNPGPHPETHIHPLFNTIVKPNFKVDKEELKSTVKAAAPGFIALELSAKLSPAEVKQIRQHTKAIVESEIYTWEYGESLEEIKGKIEARVKGMLGDTGLEVKSVIVGKPKKRRQWVKGLLAGITAAATVAGPVIGLLNFLDVS